MLWGRDNSAKRLYKVNDTFYYAKILKTVRESRVLLKILLCVI